MRKALFVLLSVFIVVSVFVSCKPEPEVKEENSIVGYLIPSFTTNVEPEPIAKGIKNTDFQTSNSLKGMEDSGVAQGVITFMPLFTNLKVVEKSKTDFIQSIQSQYGSTDSGKYSEIMYAYGLPCRIVFNDGAGNEVSHGTDDEQYLYYEILDSQDPDKVIGYFDYYCDGEKFSYRDMLLIDYDTDENIGSPLYNSRKKRVLVREYIDVPITLGSDNTPTFNIGRLVDKNKSGVPVFEDDNLIDQIGVNLNTRNNGDNNSCFATYSRDLATINSKGDIIAAFVRPDANVYEELDEVLQVDTGDVFASITESFNDPIMAIFAKEVSDEWIFDDEKDGDLNQAFESAELIYKDADSIKEHVFSIAGDNYSTYDSYNDYKLVSFKERKQGLEEYLMTGHEKFESLLQRNENFYQGVAPNKPLPGGKSSFFIQLLNLHTTTLDCSTIIDVKNKKAVSSCSKEIFYPTLLLCSNKNSKTYKGFESYYPNLKNKEGSELLSALIENHMKACGINDENYIKNLTTALINCPLFFVYTTTGGGSDTRFSPFFLKTITCEKHSDWKTDYLNTMNKLIADLTTPGSHPYTAITGIPEIELGGELNYYEKSN